MDNTVEDLTDEIMELRQDINTLTNTMMERRHITLTVPVTLADLTIIRNAREAVQRITEAERVTS